METHRRVVMLVLLVGIGLFIVGCASAGSPAAETPDSSESDQEEAAETPDSSESDQEEAAASGKTEILLWDQFGQDATEVDDIIADFNAQSEDVVVRREGMTTDQMRDILRTSIDAGEGPDVIYYDTGPGFAGVLARSDMLIPMDDAYEQYGWNDRIMPVAKERTVFDGTTYGIGHQLEVVGVFYNKRIFEELGLEVPQTHEELLAACDTIAAEGIFPIAFGDADKWPAGHTFSVFAGNIAGREKLAQAVSGETSWSDPDFVSAIDTPFVQMRERGCFNTDINALTYDDMNALFYSGQAAMTLTGTWMVSDFSDPELMPDPVGFFFYPSIDGKPIAPPTGLGSGFFVTKLAEKPEAAFSFLDYLFSRETAKRWLTEVGAIPPVEVDTTELEVSPLLSIALDELKNNSEGMGYNVDVLTPENFNNMMFDGFQEVLADEKSAEQQAADLQAEMEKASEEGKVQDITDE